MNLFVANISHTVTEEALRALFAEIGDVASVKIISDKNTGESRGYGFVDMKRDDHGMLAIQKLSNAEYFATRLVVSKARQKTTIM
jgi:RNA recognition motif-containing protein